MLNCVVLYRGDKLSGLKMVALSSNEEIVGDLANRLLAQSDYPGDSIIGAREEGIRNALKKVRREVRRGRKI